ncbi:WD40 repeat domain-containing protein [Stieleria neptunia]|uniref:WD40 repeat domain-containing protein n=1 Tax=Stieleria neptunia TaxID=2527979 RepID=UPI0018D23090|nr:hypothetical protein [Stieleria neptunia]
MLLDFQKEEITSEFSLPTKESTTAVDFSPDLESVVIGCENGSVYELDLASGEVRMYSSVGKGQVRKLDFLEDNTLVTAHHDEDVCVWDDGEITRTHGPYTSWVSSLCCYKQMVAFGLFNRHRGYQVFYGDIRQSLHKLYGNNSNSKGVAFIEEGRTLVTIGSDQQLKIWDLELGESRFTISDSEIFCAMAVLHDERLIAAGTREGSVILYRSDLP